MKGQIKRVAGGVFITEYNGEEYRLHSPGKIKIKQKLIVGDLVEFVKLDDDFVIEKVYDRKNLFIRPQAANVDIFLVVTSVSDPDFDQYLTDKLTVYALMNNAEPVILITKADIDEDRAKKISLMYKNSGIETYISKLNQDNYKEIERDLEGNLVIAVGNSGVGKSTFLNQIANYEIQKTAETSRKLGRGRHTTRHVEIFDVGSFKLIDTPGFASLDIQMPAEGYMVRDYFPEFLNLSSKCRFNTCEHVNEPGCAIKKGLKNGKIYQERYNSYIRLVDEVKKMEGKRW